MSVKDKNKKLLIWLLLASVLMFCAAFASVPLYNVFCKATGYAGYVRKAEEFTNRKIGKKEIAVRFNADVAPDLNWSFSTHHRTAKVRTGENTLIYYSVQNLNNFQSDGIAVYNVTPHKAAKYFYKIACFCFEKQTLKPNQKTIMPVSFFISEDIENDLETQDITTITLSYTFFRYQDYDEKKYQITKH